MPPTLFVKFVLKCSEFAPELTADIYQSNLKKALCLIN